MSRLRFALSYLGKPRWDTNVSPPELVELIENEALPVGNALDIGCGTGTNAIYLARHGWQVTGIDFIGRAIHQARRKARRAGVAARTRFVVGDVTRLDEYNLEAYNFVLDIGCLHGLSVSQRTTYAHGLKTFTAPGAIYLLYAFKADSHSDGPAGLQPEDVRHLFEPQFEVVAIQHGDSTIAGRGSAWYRLQRTA